MATATFNTVPAEQSTLVAPKKTTVSWKVLIVGAVMTVFVLGATAMTLTKTTSKTTTELGIACTFRDEKWSCPAAASTCALSTSLKPKCTPQLDRPA